MRLWIYHVVDVSPLELFGVFGIFFEFVPMG